MFFDNIQYGREDHHGHSDISSVFDVLVIFPDSIVFFESAIMSPSLTDQTVAV